MTRMRKAIYLDMKGEKLSGIIIKVLNKEEFSLMKLMVRRLNAPQLTKKKQIRL